MKKNGIKSFMMAGLAALSFAAPMALAGPAAADPPGYHNNYDHRDNRSAYNDGYRDAHRQDDRYDRRDDRRDYRQWRRGERASYQDRRYWREVSYRDRHWRAPPRGYHYVRDDRSGQYLLVGLATGAILGVIASH